MKNTVYFYQINKPKLYVFLYVNLHGETFKTLVHNDIWHLVDILNFEDSTCIFKKTLSSSFQ